MDNPQVTDIEIGWLLGIVDGEGCYTMSKGSKGSYNVSMKFVNTCPIIMDKIESILRRLGIPFHVYQSFRTANQRPAKRLEINGPRRLIKFLDFVLPYDFGKKDQADLLHKYITVRLNTPYGEMDDVFEQFTCFALKDAKKYHGTSETTR